MLESEVLRRLAWAKEEIELGDRMAILFAVRVCAIEGIPLPNWLSKFYVEAVDTVFEGDEKSWDSAFGEPWPGLQQRTIKNHIRDMIRVVSAIHARPKNCPIDLDLFASVGKKLGLGPSVVRDLWCSTQNPFARSAETRREIARSNRRARQRPMNHAT